MEFPAQRADANVGGREDVVQANHRQPVVVLRMQSEIADDRDAHADGYVALDHLGIVHLEDHVIVDAAFAAVSAPRAAG